MLKITKSTDPMPVEQLTLCIYAVPGVGKTSIGFTAEKPLLLDFDRGAYRSGFRKDTVVVAQWSDVAQISQDDLKPYKTLIIDTAGRALDAMTVDIISENPKLGNRSGGLSLQGYGELKNRFLSYTKLMRSFGLDIVLLAHSDEQRSGDEVIERLDVQGGSKNEIYKSSDVMGRIFLRQGQRKINFSPSDVSFGKNPAGFPEFAVPDFGVTSDFLATLIAKTKESLNKQSTEQLKAAQTLAQWATRFDTVKDPDGFNKELAAMPEVAEDIRDNVKRLLLKAAKKSNLDFDKKSGKFVAKPAEEKAPA